MALDGPMSVGLISRLGKPEINTAAFLIMMSLSIWIESPIIDLLSTSTTLSKNHQHYVTLSRFVLYLLAGVTVAHFLIVFTPFYWFVTETGLNLKHEVAEAARLGMMIMLLWSAVIGWRRYLQGILIRFGSTRSVGIGTMLRVCVMFGVGVALFYYSHLPSVVIAAIALMTSVAAEAAFVHWLARPVIAEHLSAESHSDEPPLTMKKLTSFHFPLTATTMVHLTTLPVIGAALARMPNPIPSLAGYEVASTILFVHRAPTYSLTDVVITLYKGAASSAALRRFCTLVGLSLSGFLFTLALTGLDRIIFADVLGAKLEVAKLAHLAFLASGLAPLLEALQGYVRGMLTAHHLTVSRLVAILVASTVLVTTLSLGVIFRWTGPATAGAAITLSLSSEFGILLWSWTRRSRQIGTLPG